MTRRFGTRLASQRVGAALIAVALLGMSEFAMSLHGHINLLGSTTSRSVATADVDKALQAASRATGVDFSYLVANASLESSLDPMAKAKTSSAAGLFQFIDSTWEGMVERHGAKIGLANEAEALKSGDISAAERKRIMNLRYDAGVAARLGAEFAAENAAHLRQSLKREPEDVDLYLAHFLGPGGATKFLERIDATPSAAAAQAFPAAAKANPSVFYKNGQAQSFAEIRDAFEAKLAGRKDLPLPTASAPTLGGTRAAQPTAGLPRTADAIGAGGDPYLGPLVTAQLSMNDSLGQAKRAASDAHRSFRELLS